jgi:hypothetical protein
MVGLFQQCGNCDIVFRAAALCCSLAMMPDVEIWQLVWITMITNDRTDCFTPFACTQDKVRFHHNETLDHVPSSRIVVIVYVVKGRQHSAYTRLHCLGPLSQRWCMRLTLDLDRERERTSPSPNFPYRGWRRLSTHWWQVSMLQSWRRTRQRSTASNSESDRSLHGTPLVQNTCTNTAFAWPRLLTSPRYAMGPFRLRMPDLIIGKGC